MSAAPISAAQLIEAAAIVVTIGVSLFFGLTVWACVHVNRRAADDGDE